MAMRPPSNDTSAAAAMDFGIARVDAELDRVDIEYPVSAEELQRDVGHIEVPYDTRGRTVNLGEAIADTNVSEFEDEQALLNELYPVFDEWRSGSLSVVERVRGALPF
ncbi:hypothetical protein [Haloarchaeobius sp. HME9146]|uniref:hypothetical protein n=1 Tax=Haloarchaeobius sp. HME9146 TaxID=2978732 RepID=UPI0021C07F6D|nr:hypothetical protein [Haloarchaeobius sp. HME9146]MCT9097034.1 hypothetical protein [Haloarchaeobius sp. HME9146]